MGCTRRKGAGTSYTQADLEALTEPLPQGLRLTLRKLLQPRPEARYPTARELAAELRRWLGEGAAYARNEAAAELHEMAKRSREVLVELGMRRPRGGPSSQDEISTSQP
jgi:eukaryotic-like serine/threonine-protein kinase